MHLKLMAAIGVALGLALPQAAAQTADFLTAKKVACVPDRIIRCDAANKCETKDATAADKTEVLVIDFTVKKASVRKAGKEEPFGDVADDKVEGELRTFAVKSGNESMAMRLTKAGALTLLLEGEKNRAEATCSAES
jgi:hypothetical protein